MALSNCTQHASNNEPTPTPWHVGSTWAVSVFARNHQLVGSMVVRLTGEKARSCIGGDWKQLEILKRQFNDSARDAESSAGRSLLATKPLSYSIGGNRLLLGVTEVCDAYVFLRGVLKDEWAAGDYGWLHPYGFTILGSFTAYPCRGRCQQSLAQSPSNNN